MTEQDVGSTAARNKTAGGSSNTDAGRHLSRADLLTQDASLLVDLLLDACLKHPDIAANTIRRLSDSAGGDLRPKPSVHATEPMMVGSCPAMKEVFRAIRRYAATSAPILITGESGTGKELAAAAIHERSTHANGPFVAVNCGGLPATLIGSELFGHEKGAFTGAGGRRIGHLEAADGGTLLLDEIGDMPIELQTNFLRFLETREIERLGGNQLIRVDTRVVAATNIDLEQAVNQGRFRRDLYFRLDVLRIHLPPLRDREGDMELLVRFFLQRLSKELGIGEKGIKARAMDALQAYHWPGNIRELISRMRRALVMAAGDELEAEDFQISGTLVRHGLGEPETPVDAGVYGTQSDPRRLPEVRQQAEADAIVSALERSRYNVSRAARELGISRATMYKRMQKLGIER